MRQDQSELVVLELAIDQIRPGLVWRVNLVCLRNDKEGAFLQANLIGGLDDFVPSGALGRLANAVIEADIGSWGKSASFGLLFRRFL